MANHDVDVPIKRLHPDLLSPIFLANTSPTSDLAQARRSAKSGDTSLYPCLLSGEGSWFKFADINDPWRNEVLKRTGSALLWIKGSLRSEDQYNLFLCFLEKNWRRIEYLEIFEGRDALANRHDLRLELWKGLEAQAPNLRSFTIQNFRNPPPVRYRTAIVTCFLFKGGAPLLREISIPHIKFDTHSPWLPNITRLILLSYHSVQEIIQILRATPFLTKLETTLSEAKLKAVVGQSAPNLSFGEDRLNISLPHLETLDLRASFDDALPLFESLDLPASCVLHFDLWQDVVRQTDLVALQNTRQAIEIIRHRIIEWMRGYLDLCSMSFFMIMYSEQQRKLYISGSHARGELEWSLEFLSSSDHIASPMFLEELSLCDYLRPVKETVLDIRAYPSETSYLARFSSYSQSLTMLVTQEHTLKFLLDSSTAIPGSPAFPSLQTLQLTSLAPPMASEKYPSQVIYDFFQWQIAGGSPVAVFDLTELSYKVLYNMEYLDIIFGLKTVKWSEDAVRTTQYGCGSGHPEALRFGKKE